MTTPEKSLEPRQCEAEESGRPDHQWHRCRLAQGHPYEHESECGAMSWTDGDTFVPDEDLIEAGLLTPAPESLEEQGRCAQCGHEEHELGNCCELVDEVGPEGKRYDEVCYCPSGLPAPSPEEPRQEAPRYRVWLADRLREHFEGIEVSDHPRSGVEITYSWHGGGEQYTVKYTGGGSTTYRGVYHPHNGMCEGDGICEWCGRTLW